jgi:3-hydroxyisobutyrate dehydrogenase
MSEKRMSHVTVLGLGAMGSRMAFNLLKAGFKVTVWNRSSGPVDALKKQGAEISKTPREAVCNSDIVIAMLRDDVASRNVWTDPVTGAIAGMKSDAIAVDCSTLTPSWTRELEHCCALRGFSFIEAPVAGSRPQAEAAQLIFFVGGKESTVALAEPVLKALGASIHHAGRVGNAALIKLMVNTMFGLQLAGLAELLGMAREAGLDLSKALEIFSATPVASPAAKVAGSAMLAGNFAPMFPLNLVEKDFAYVLQMASQVNSSVPLAKAVHQVLTGAIEKDLGELNITGLATIY